MKTLFRKLKSQNGESIGEVLVATLIVALGSVMFASMVSTSERLIQRSDSAYKEYLEDYNSIEENPLDPKKGTAASVKITSEDGSVGIQLNASEPVKVYQGSDKRKRYFIYGPTAGTGK